MKLEFSAGGVVYKKENNKIWVLLCQHSFHHGWGFPKGLIGDKEERESKESTALREVEEETGARGKIRKALDPVSFWYKFEGEKVKKTVYFFVMEYLEGDITQHDFEMENVEWVESELVLGKLTFESERNVFQQALPIINNIISKQ